MRKIICCLLVVLVLVGIIAIIGNNESEAKNVYENTIADRNEVRASHILVKTRAEAIQIKKDIDTLSFRI
mgnify:CR=1 FL=1